MRCPDCNRFVSHEESDDIEIDLSITIWPGADGVDVYSIEGMCAIENLCGECGTALCNFTFNVDVQLEPEQAAKLLEHKGDGHSLFVKVETESRASRSTGYGRGLRTYYGAEISCAVFCTCQDAARSRTEGEEPVEPILSGIAWHDDVQASEMDPC